MRTVQMLTILEVPILPPHDAVQHVTRAVTVGVTVRQRPPRPLGAEVQDLLQDNAAEVLASPLPESTEPWPETSAVGSMIRLPDPPRDLREQFLQVLRTIADLQVRVRRNTMEINPALSSPAVPNDARLRVDRSSSRRQGGQPSWKTPPSAATSDSFGGQTAGRISTPIVPGRGGHGTVLGRPDRPKDVLAGDATRSRRDCTSFFTGCVVWRTSMCGPSTQRGQGQGYEVRQGGLPLGGERTLALAWPRRRTHQGLVRQDDRADHSAAALSGRTRGSDRRGGVAIEMGADAQDIGLIVHPHPTYSETIGMAAEAFEEQLSVCTCPRRSTPDRLPDQSRTSGLRMKEHRRPGLSSPPHRPSPKVHWSLH